MFIRAAGDPLTTASPSASANAAPIVIDAAPMPPLGLIALKLYAFGGLAFVGLIIVSAITYWIWTVVIKREFADSPPELELHPERMREKEKARIARRKKRRDEKKDLQRRQNEERFLVPPIRHDDTSSQCQSPRSDSPCLEPSKPALRKSSTSSVGSVRRSGGSGGKRVSWASSMLTLDQNGQLGEKPVQDTPLKSSLDLMDKKPDLVFDGSPSRGEFMADGNSDGNTAPEMRLVFTNPFKKREL